MKKLYFLLLPAFLFSLAAGAQKVNGSVRGMLQDSLSAQALTDATVSLVNVQDSSLVSFTLTGPSGSFEIKNIAAGRYLVVASFSGLESLKKPFSITAESPSVDLGFLRMQRAYKTLDEVIITDDAPVKVKGDTIAFKADAFKTKPNATVEDLLKKLPGLQVERDGTVKAQGENVQKVYVDGKEFFSNDPKLATKNLTADMVDQVEVYDDMSEQAKFNGIDDGSRTKAINLKLKKEKKKGLFGRANAGYGTDNRYEAGLSANFFKGATQLNVIGRANNTNNMSFTMNDMNGMFSGGGGMGGGNMMMGGRGGMRGGGGGGFSGGAGNGITSSWNTGINYRDVWSPKFDVNGSYSVSHANFENLRKSYTQSFFPTNTFIRDRQSLSNNLSDNHRFGFNMVYQIDSFNSVIYSPGISYQHSYSFMDDTLVSYLEGKGVPAYKASNTRSISNTVGNGYNWNNNLIWRHRFRRQGRTLSVNLSNTQSRNIRDGYIFINEDEFDPTGLKVGDRDQNYRNDNEGRTNNMAATVSYTEPIGRGKVLELNYNHTRNGNESDRQTLNYNPASTEFDKLVDSLSNHFQNRNESDRFGGNFRFVKKRYNFQLGFAVQNTLLESDNLTKNTLISNRYTNLFPTASFNYQFARSRNLRFNYRGRTNQPSITQLQDVADYTRYPYVYIGNPDLNQEFTHSFTASYNFFDAVKFRNLFAYLSYNTTQNRIANSTEQVGGVEYTRPVNLNGAYNLSGTVNMGFPIRKMKGGNFNTNTRVMYNRDVSMVNRQLNYSGNLTIGEDLRLSYNHKEKLDLGIAVSVTYNSVSYTTQPARNDDYFMHTYSADISYVFPKGFILTTDVDYTFNTGRADGFNQNYALWNGGLAKEAFKGRGEFRLSVYDILKQNLSISRNISANYIEDVQNTVLQRFFMLGFTWKLNRMGGKSMPVNNQRGGVGRQMRMMGN